MQVDPIDLLPNQDRFLGYTMDSRLLYCFLQAAEKGSFTAAAQAMHMTQPALSKNIQHLEKDLGVELFTRLPGGVALTRFGAALARRAKLIEHEIRHAQDEIEAMKHGSAGSITIGVGPFSTNFYLPEAIAAVQRRNPDIKVNLVSSVVDSLLPKLLQGEVDLFCTALDFPDHSEITKEFLMDVRHVVVARQGHPLAGKQHVETSELLDYPWAALAGDHVWLTRMAGYFAANGARQPRVGLETNTTDGLLSIVRHSDMLASSSFPIDLPIGVPDLVEIPIRGSFWKFRVGLAYRNAALQNPTLKELITEVKRKAVEPLRGDAASPSGPTVQKPRPRVRAHERSATRRHAAKA